MTPTPEELRNLINRIERSLVEGTAMPNEREIMSSLRACADILERGPKITDEVVHDAYKCYWSSRLKALPAMRETLESICGSIWPVPIEAAQPQAEKATPYGWAFANEETDDLQFSRKEPTVPWPFQIALYTHPLDLSALRIVHELGKAVNAAAPTQGAEAKCPYIVTGKEGTSHCRLAEQDGRDAARYRWLREHHDSLPNDWHVRNPTNDIPDIGTLDAAIDAAMHEQEHPDDNE